MHKAGTPARYRGSNHADKCCFLYLREISRSISTISFWANVVASSKKFTQACQPLPSTRTAPFSVVAIVPLRCLQQGAPKVMIRNPPQAVGSLLSP